MHLRATSCAAFTLALLGGFAAVHAGPFRDDLLLEVKQRLGAELQLHPDRAAEQTALTTVIQFEWGEKTQSELCRALDQAQAEIEDPQLHRLCAEFENPFPSLPAENELAQQIRVREKIGQAADRAFRALTIESFDEPLRLLAEQPRRRDGVPGLEPSLQGPEEFAEESFKFLRDFQDALAAFAYHDTFRRSALIDALPAGGAVLDPYVHRSAYLPAILKMQQQEFDWIHQPQSDPDILRKIRTQAAEARTAGELSPVLTSLRLAAQEGQVNPESLPEFKEWLTLYQWHDAITHGAVDMRLLEQAAMVRSRFEPGPYTPRIDLRWGIFTAAAHVFLQSRPMKEDQAGEPPIRFFSKLTLRAIKEHDWDLLSRTIDLMRQARLEEVASPLDLCGLESFLGARVFEKAGQLEFAVAMNELALSTGCQLLPLDLIHDSLTRCEQQDPAAFARGIAILPSKGAERRRHDTNRLPSP